MKIIKIRIPLGSEFESIELIAKEHYRFIVAKPLVSIHRKRVPHTGYHVSHQTSGFKITSKVLPLQNFAI